MTAGTGTVQGLLTTPLRQGQYMANGDKTMNDNGWIPIHNT